jgi:hypothetical protein
VHRVNLPSTSAAPLGPSRPCDAAQGVPGNRSPSGDCGSPNRRHRPPSEPSSRPCHHAQSLPSPADPRRLDAVHDFGWFSNAGPAEIGLRKRFAVIFGAHADWWLSEDDHSPVRVAPSGARRDPPAGPLRHGTIIDNAVSIRNPWNPSQRGELDALVSTSTRRRSSVPGGAVIILGTAERTKQVNVSMIKLQTIVDQGRRFGLVRVFGQCLDYTNRTPRRR